MSAGDHYYYYPEKYGRIVTTRDKAGADIEIELLRIFNRKIMSNGKEQGGNRRKNYNFHRKQ